MAADGSVALLKQENQQLRYLLREERLTTDWLNRELDGANYELHQRDLRLKEQDRYIEQLQQQIEELKKQATADVPPPMTGATPVVPPFVKPNLPRGRRRKRPGRKKGHEAALRPMPRKIDHHQKVPLQETDAAGKPLCPKCKAYLLRLRRRKRIVEDLIRSAAATTCYHTQSGYCPQCKRQIESRAPEQPPAASVPHGQLGINALTTGVILRVRHRLPFRMIAQLLADMAGLRVSAGGLVKQLKRIARWLDGKYQDLIRQMRASPYVHADETGWRMDGRNFWLWAFTDPTFTLYHIDESRGGKVPLKLLGKAFDGTIIADFYSGYDQFKGPKQRCLTHLMRETRELGERDASFADTPLHRKLMRWCRDALRLKKRWSELADDKYEIKASHLENRLDGLIKLETDHADALRLRKRLKKHRKELTRFLWHKKLDGTNNAAERALRPAVVMRKITGGSRRLAAATAWAKVASLLRSADQRNLGVFDATKKLIMDYWATRGQ
jgi:transposase